MLKSSTSRGALCAGLIFCGVACGTSDPNGSDAGGASSSAGSAGAPLSSAGTGGGVAGSASGTAGVSGSGSNLGGAGGASAGATQGGSSSGGAPAAAGSGGSSGGNATSGGSSGSGGSGGSSGAASTGTPSAGCGKSGRPPNGVVTVTNDHIYNFPETYDGKTPMPMVLMLHAAGNPYTQLQNLSNGTKLATDFVRVFPKSAGSAWVYNTDASRVTTVFNDVMANYCVDTSRVFITGHSSGAQMAVQMLCAAGGDKRFKAAAPVAASKYCSKVSPIPVMYIQGQMDAMRGNGNGIDVVNLFASSNSCGTMTVPDTAVSTCNSTFDKALVTPGCVTYQGCTQPTIWCSHNDNGYNATDGHMHGWPCFASNAMADFFSSLK